MSRIHQVTIDKKTIAFPFFQVLCHLSPSRYSNTLVDFSARAHIFATKIASWWNRERERECVCVWLLPVVDLRHCTLSKHTLHDNRVSLQRRYVSTISPFSLLSPSSLLPTISAAARLLFSRTPRIGRRTTVSDCLISLVACRPHLLSPHLFLSLTVGRPPTRSPFVISNFCYQL